MRFGYVDTALGQVHYSDEGTGDAVVLLPQAGRTSRMLAPTLTLIGRYYRAIGLDLPGFGRVPPPRDVTIDILADCLVEALDGLGIERAHLYGLHTGNKIATAVAVRHPNRIDTLILAGQSHSLVPNQTSRNEAIYAVTGGRYGRPRPIGAAEARAAEWSAVYRGVADLWWSERLLARGLQESDLAQARAGALDAIETMTTTSDIYRANFQYDLGAAFGRIATRTLILEIATPQEDRVIGRQGEAVQSMIPGSQLATIEDARDGIVTLEDRPVDVAAAIWDFLECARKPGADVS